MPAFRLLTAFQKGILNHPQSRFRADWPCTLANQGPARRGVPPPNPHDVFVVYDGVAGKILTQNQAVFEAAVAFWVPKHLPQTPAGPIINA